VAIRPGRCWLYRQCLYQRIGTQDTTLYLDNDVKMRLKLELTRDDDRR
jgi:hypothetical protein